AQLVYPPAVLAHGADGALVAGRGHENAELARVVDGDLRPADRDPGDAGDESAGLHTAQPHGGRFAGPPGVAQIDVVVPTLQVEAGIEAYGGVAAAGAVVERLVAQGGGEGAITVVQQYLIAASGVENAVPVVSQYLVTAT